MSISSNFPSIRPSLLLDFANTKSLDPRITFTRASTGTFYDGRTVAKAEENLILQSQAFDAGWVISGVGISATANTSVAPDGTTTADTIIEDTANNIHTSGQTTASGLVTTSGVVTFSVFAKLGSGTRFLTIGVSKDASNHGSATFDLSLGTNTQTQATGTYSAASATITASTQGFYRCTFTVTTDSVTAARVGLNNTGAPTALNRGFGSTYTGDGTSSLIVWGAQLEQRSSVTAYTATTTQTITNYVPALQTAASGVARFEHNPVTGESLGLEIEEQRTNLLTYSEQFDNAIWVAATGGTGSARTITPNLVIAPDGTQSADVLVLNKGAGTTGSDFSGIAQSFSATSGTSYAASIWLKSVDGNSYSVNLRCTWAASPDNMVTVTGSWQRFTVAVASNATASRQFQIILIGGTTPAPSNTANLAVWGAQLEAGAFATSYIQTVASQVTRSADVATMTRANFSSWYRADEGTLYAEGVSVNAITGTTARRYAELNDGSTSNVLSVEFRNTTQSRFSVTTSGVSQASITGGGTINQFSKIAGSYQVNNFAFCANGVLGAQDTSGSVPVVTQLSIGNRSDNLNASAINGTIKKLAFYPLRLTDAELQGLTTV